MSWQAYVDTQLLGAGASRAAICGRNDSTVWAHSAGVALLPEEVCRCGAVARATREAPLSDGGRRLGPYRQAKAAQGGAVR